MSAINCYGMRLKSISVLAIIALMLLQFVDNRTMLKWTSINCKSLHKDYIYFKSCAIKALKRDVSALSVYAALLQKPLDNITLALFFKKRGLPNSRALYQYEIEACKFFRNKRRNPLAVMFYNIMGFEKYSNMNHSCPYNHDLILEGYSFDQKYTYLLPFPAGYYTIVSEWSLNKILRAIVDINVEISEI